MSRWNQSEAGSVVISLLGLVLLGALAGSLVILAHTETMISGNFSAAQEAFYAAEAGLQIGIDDLAHAPDWDALVSGPATSAFADGLPGGSRTLPDGTALNLSDVTAQLQGRAWRLFAFGPFSRLQAGSRDQSTPYVVVWIADDEAAGPDVVALRAEAFGLGGTRRSVEALVSQQQGVLSWHEAR